MSLSLPAEPAGSRSLTGVVPQMLASLEGRSDWFPRAASAIVFVLDGLGAHNLAARAGHARFLSQMSSKRDVARTVFPSTTASALTSLLTGVLPGEHGIVGYRTRIPGTDDVVNQLRGWDTGGTPAGVAAGRRRSPRAVRASRCPRPSTQAPGFTGGDPRGAPSSMRPTISMSASRWPPNSRRGIRDPSSISTRRTSMRVGHRRGWQSDEWVAALERTDAAARALSSALARGTGAGRHRRPRHGRRAAAPPRAADGGRRARGRRAPHRRRAADAAPVRRARGRGETCWRRGGRPSRALLGALTRGGHRRRGCSARSPTRCCERIGDVVVAPRAGIAYYDDRPR